MRILHFCRTYYPDTIGGIEQVVYQLSDKSKSYGIDATVLTLSANPKGEVVFAHHKVHQAKLSIEISSCGISRQVFGMFKSLAATSDIIHYHYPWPFMDLVHLTMCPRLPTIVTYHSDVIRQRRAAKIYTLLQTVFLRSVDRIVATSPNYLKSSGTLQRYNSKTEVIPIGIDEAMSLPLNESIVRVWQEKLPKKFFLFVGVLRYYKGLDVLLSATRNACLPLVIVGSGPEESRLSAMANEMRLKNLHFLGILSDQDKNAVLSLCYGFIFPSNMRSEAFGISLLEAAMFGKPMISCEIGTGTSFINIHDQTGIVIPPNDSQALSYAMRFLWEHPDQAMRMGRAARARYLQHFTADKMVSAYCKIYRELTDKHKSAPTI